ncbi:hypothetical protein B0H19DRAFT_1157366 [Mycena capillaripes]|nr:hypothetical protein B0H19DRAFT_1157366 [Mycena capillaripes]
MSTSTQPQTESRTSSTAANINGVHPSAVGANTLPDATKTQPTNEAQSTNKEAVDADHLDPTYPEQKHAGAVGYGPNYNPKAGVFDKITGLKEQVQGKISHNPDLVEKGHERATGELKQKELKGDDADPFADPEEKKKKAEAAAPESTTTNGTTGAESTTSA